MSSVANFENGFNQQNYFAFKRESMKVGTLYATNGINAFETIKPYVVKKLSKVSSGSMIIAGEAVEVDSTTGKVQPVGSGTPAYIALTSILTTFDKVKKTNNGNCMFSVVAEKDDQEIALLPIEANKNLQIVMQTKENVVAGDGMIFDTDNQVLKKAGENDTALFKVVYDAKAYNGVVVVLI